MIALQLNKGPVRELESLDAVCSLLCHRLPVDIYYGQSSLMTCVEVVPRDLLHLNYPDANLRPSDDFSDYVLVFRDIITSQGVPRVLDTDFIDKIRVVTQSRRCKDSKPCGTCTRFERCQIGG